MSVVISFYCKQCREKSEVKGFKDLTDFFDNYVCKCGYKPNIKEYSILTFKRGDLIRHAVYPTYKKQNQQNQQSPVPSF